MIRPELHEHDIQPAEVLPPMPEMMAEMIGLGRFGTLQCQTCNWWTYATELSRRGEVRFYQ